MARTQALVAKAVWLALVGCSPDAGRAGEPYTPPSTDEGSTGGDTSTTTSSGEASEAEAEAEADSSGGLPPLQACTYESTSYGDGMIELDVPTGSAEVLTFIINGLPSPALIESAVLRFDSYDADHPGEEGVVFVNGGGAFDLPADAGWDNAAGSGTIAVGGLVVAGQNRIEFGAGTLAPGSFYRIGNVALDVDAFVEDCEPAEQPPGDPVPRQIDYQDATYTQRHNWVLRCDDYAFTAAGDDHLDSDCEGLYAPDGTRRGTATFSFLDLEPGTYEIQIRSRHTINRNPFEALFVVDGEPKRINQRDDAGYTTDIWGTRDLGGDITVVLDSSQESESDSVIWVRLEPV